MNARYVKMCHQINCRPLVGRDPSKIRILSVDGGGIRTLIPLIFMFEMEIGYGRSINTLFDVYGGSGFGGLLISALNISSQVNPKKPKYSCADLISWYNNNCRIIFH